MSQFAPQSKIKIALIGIGKIARDQHVPHLAISPDFVLAACVTHGDGVEGVPSYDTLAQMCAAQPDIKAVSICTPPIGRLDLIKQALNLGLDVMIEKPPAATMDEANDIVSAAKSAGRVLYVTWHSRQARAVAPAKAWLSKTKIKSVQVNWKEDVRVWHPGQAWIWGEGIGVFDPGINALSVITDILPTPLVLNQADLFFPANKPSAIAANLDMSANDIPVRVEFDFDQSGQQVWEIICQTKAGVCHLTHGASRFFLDGVEQEIGDSTEYGNLYARFGTLLRTGQSDTDLRPFELVQSAYKNGTKKTVAAFEDF